MTQFPNLFIKDSFIIFELNEIVDSEQEVVDLNSIDSDLPLGLKAFKSNNRFNQFIIPEKFLCECK